MLGEKYTLDIRPTFIDELDRAVTYIEQNLGNPVAADKLVNDTYEESESFLDSTRRMVESWLSGG